jgi:hypothetical protein
MASLLRATESKRSRSGEKSEAQGGRNRDTRSEKDEHLLDRRVDDAGYNT